MSQPTLFDLPATRKRAKTPGRGHKVPVAPRPDVPPVVATPTVMASGTRTWVLTFPAPDRILSINTGKHWRVTSPVKKTWRDAMYQHAKRAGLPTGLARVRIDIEIRFPSGGRRDAPNYHPYVAKPLVDALGPGRQYTVRKGKLAGTVVREKGYGLIPDDTAVHLDGPHLTIGAPVGRRAGYGEVVVTITDLSGADHVL